MGVVLPVARLLLGIGGACPRLSVSFGARGRPCVALPVALVVSMLPTSVFGVILLVLMLFLLC